MIEQLHISTTPKYNFPRLAEFPQQLLEISIRTLKYSSFNQHEVQIENNINSINTQNMKLIKLSPADEEVPVAAVDVSSIKVGETINGTVIAIRGAIVYRKNEKYRYLKIGPFPFHITEENKGELYRLFGAHPASILNEAYQVTVAPEINYLQSKITSVFERWLHLSLASSLHNSLILLDGSLTAGNLEKTAETMQKLIETAKRNGNIVLAISKISRIRVGGLQISDFAYKLPSPCLVELDNLQFRYGGIKNLGRIYLAKLNGSKVFRLDIYRETPKEEGIKAVEKLLASDLLIDGYPETLRLAHILSTFTANEIVGIQRYLNERFNFRIFDRLSIRKILFGPYGTHHET